MREITVDKAGLAQSAIYYDEQGKAQEQKARVVVMACNGIGTPRLLLNSRSSLFPDGLANSSGLLGENFMFHPSSVVTGIFEERLDTYKGAYTGMVFSHEFYETDPNRDFLRGSHWIIVRGFAGPLSVAYGGRLGRGVPWGPQHHRPFKERFAHTISIVVLCEDLPEERNQVVLDPELTDGSGVPAPRISYRV